jgi:hypothetical protein
MAKLDELIRRRDGRDRGGAGRGEIRELREEAKELQAARTNDIADGENGQARPLSALRPLPRPLLRASDPISEQMSKPMIPTGQDSLGTRSTLRSAARLSLITTLARRARRSATSAGCPYSMKVLLENLLRFEDGVTVTRDDLQAMVDWQKERRISREIQYRPARVLMQDFTGVPAVVDLAAMRDAMKQLGGDPQKINPLVPVHLVIDHSVMVDEFGTPQAADANVDYEYARNRERYEFLKWGSQAFDNFKVVPPGTGICHQVNLEYICQTVWTSADQSARRWPIPTRWSAPTATRPWSTAWACSAGASAGSRRRPRCSASRSPCSSPKWSASA